MSMHPCAPRFSSTLTFPSIGTVEVQWDEDDNMPLVYSATSADGGIKWFMPDNCWEPIESQMCESGFFWDFMDGWNRCDDDVSLSFVSHDREPTTGGTPISQISGRPGHDGYDEWLRISASWGHP